MARDDKLEAIRNQGLLPARKRLRRRLRLRLDRGFTLVELIVTCAIIVVLTAIAIPSIAAAIENAKVGKACADIHSIGTSIIGYDAVQGVFPNALSDVGFGNFNDPWGNPYQYLNFASVNGKGKMRKDRFLVPINSSFDLYSMGPDGQSVPPLTAQASQDDVIWANDGSYIGLASQY